MASAFWQASVPNSQWREMDAKYRALQHLEQLPAGDQQKFAIRTAARRWPGALRESQLVGPQRCEQRRRCAERAGGQEARTRAHWRARGDDFLAVVLWIELHLLLADHVAWRKSLVQQGSDASTQAFLTFVGARDPGRWPTSAATLQQTTGPRIRARTAYLWLAKRAEMSLPDLNLLLFARRGHWDHRPGDPVGKARAELPQENKN